MLMQLDGTFIFVVISFLIFLFIIKALLYNPFSKVIDERQNFFDKNLKMQNDSYEKSKNLIQQKEALLKDAKTEASNIIKTTKDETKEISNAKLKKAHENIKIEADEYNSELINQSDFAKNEIKKEISSFVSEIISKVLKEDIKVDIDETKIGKYL